MVSVIYQKKMDGEWALPFVELRSSRDPAKTSVSSRRVKTHSPSIFFLINYSNPEISANIDRKGIITKY